MAALPKPEPNAAKKGSKKVRRLVVPEISDAQVPLQAFFFLFAPIAPQFNALVPYELFRRSTS